MPTQLNNDIAFIHVPKTGGTSISTLFPYPQMFITKYLDILKDEDHYLLIHAPANLTKVHEPNLKMMIGFVRNPYTRFISIFCTSKGLAIHNYSISIEGITQFCNDFKQSGFNQHTIFKPMKYFVYDNSECIVDRIFYYEDFENAVKTIAELINIETSSAIPHLNNNLLIHQNEYMEWYDKCPLLYDFVNDIYEEDFKSFNYQMINSNM